MFRGAQKVIEPHPDGLSDELAAFANADGGTVVLGVDDKTLMPTGIPAAQMEAVRSWLRGIINDRITPPLDIHTQNIEIPNAAGEMVTVVVVTVPRSLWIHESLRFEEQGVADTSLNEADALLLRRFIRQNEGDDRKQLRRLHLLADLEGQECLSVARAYCCVLKSPCAGCHPPIFKLFLTAASTTTPTTNWTPKISTGQLTGKSGMRSILSACT